MSQNQREAWERVQLMLQRRKGGFGGIPGGGRGGGMGLAGLVLLGVGSWAVSNSLFNGTVAYVLAPGRSQSNLFVQLTVVIVLLSTLESVV